jgi:hypothetical protein
MPAAKSTKASNAPKQTQEEIADDWIQNSDFNESALKEALGKAKKDGEDGRMHECHFFDQFNFAGPKGVAEKVRVRLPPALCTARWLETRTVSRARA